MESMNWDAGQLITLTPGDTAKCDGQLNSGELYCLCFYNTANSGTDTNVTVTGSNGMAPVSVKVPGSVLGEGLAGLCFVEGDQTNSVGISVLQDNPGAKIEAFIISVKFPTGNNTNILTKELPFDGQMHPFYQFTRYQAVPSARFYSGTVKSNIQQFISVFMIQNEASVIIVNSGLTFKDFETHNIITYLGDAKQNVKSKVSSRQSVSHTFNGASTFGGSFVWVNADSTQNSESAEISMQPL